MPKPARKPVKMKPVRRSAAKARKPARRTAPKGAGAKSTAAKPTSERKPASEKKVTPFLMFDDQLGAAIELYTRILPDSEVRNMARDGQDGPVRSAEFVIGGQKFMAFNGGPHFRFTEGFSLFVNCADQAEVDRIWGSLVTAGAKPSQCGWITDPFGLSWQVVPRRFMELIADENPRKVQAVFGAMMKMQKLDVKTLEAASASV